MMVSPRVSQAALDAKALQLGLDQPIIVQYWIWLREVLRGNLGFSYTSFRPVAEMIREYLSPTLLLMGTSLLVGLLVAIPAGIYSAVRQYTKSDYAIVTSSLLISSIPTFFLCLLLIFIFTVKLGWLPSSGMKTLGIGGGFADIARHMVMPVLVQAAAIAGRNVRYIRSSMLEILQQNYLRTAKAKGIGRFRVIYKHALRNALIPIVTVVGMEIPVLFGGTVIVEQIFSWPGLGLMTMSAILKRDYPVIMGVALMAAVVVLVANLPTFYTRSLTRRFNWSRRLYVLFEKKKS